MIKQSSIFSAYGTNRACILYQSSFIILAAGRINVHLALGTIKLKAKTATIA
jgi:hypothetical protein